MKKLLTNMLFGMLTLGALCATEFDNIKSEVTMPTESTVDAYEVINDYVRANDAYNRMVHKGIEPGNFFDASLLLRFVHEKEAAALVLTNLGQPVLTNKSTYADITPEWKISILARDLTLELMDNPSSLWASLSQLIPEEESNDFRAQFVNQMFGDDLSA